MSRIDNFWCGNSPKKIDQKALSPRAKSGSIPEGPINICIKLLLSDCERKVKFQYWPGNRPKKFVPKHSFCGWDGWVDGWKDVDLKSHPNFIKYNYVNKIYVPFENWARFLIESAVHLIFKFESFTNRTHMENGKKLKWLIKLSGSASWGWELGNTFFEIPFEREFSNIWL